MEDIFLYMIIQIYNHKERYVKIGVSSHLDARLVSLQAGNANTLTLLRAYKFRSKTGAFRVEKIVHGLLFSRRMNGEWFDVPWKTAELAFMVAVKEKPLQELADALSLLEDIN